MTIQQEQPWQETARKVQADRDRSIAQVKPPIPLLPSQLPSRVIDIPRQHLSSEELAITESSAKDLVSALSTGNLTATATVKAFLRRAALAQKLTNCIYELLPERALARAKELDDYFSQHGKPSGPLHGLPVSTKENVNIAGRDHTMGFVGWVGRKSPDDAVPVKIFQQAGAVMYARTTVPQGLMAIETCSNLTGDTINPHNTALSSGGSSGGESALQALHGSPLGIAGDIGGSVRVPATNCGLYGLKPTTGRLPLVGPPADATGCETITATVGPISPTLGGVELFMKTMLGSQPWLQDPSLHSIPWRDHESHVHLNEKRLTVGVMWNDGVVEPAPPVTRALMEVVGRLRRIPDIKVIEWKPYQQAEALEILTRLYFPDGGEAFARDLDLSAEPYLPLTAYAARDAPGIEFLSPEAIRDWVARRDKFRCSYLQEWNTVAPEMDVILCPASPMPAPPLHCSRYWGYSSIWNLLDYPALVFPVTKVDPLRDGKDMGYTPRNDMDRWYHERYDAYRQRDAPVGLQLVAGRLEDEKLVQAFKEIQDKIGLPFVDCLV